MMTPRDFLEQIVRPNLSEFDADRSDLRRALNALASVDALAAHMFVWLEANTPTAVSGIGDDSHYRTQLAQRSTDFSLARDTAKAQKHVKLTKHNPQVSSASQMKSRRVGYGEGGWGDSPWGGGTVVAIELDDGSLAIAGPTLARALAFLEHEMTTQGI
jgi:hypothetical protein